MLPQTTVFMDQYMPRSQASIFDHCMNVHLANIQTFGICFKVDVTWLVFVQKPYDSMMTHTKQSSHLKHKISTRKMFLQGRLNTF